MNNSYHFDDRQFSACKNRDVYVAEHEVKKNALEYSKSFLITTSSANLLFAIKSEGCVHARLCA